MANNRVISATYSLDRTVSFMRALGHNVRILRRKNIRISDGYQLL